MRLMIHLLKESARINEQELASGLVNMDKALPIRLRSGLPFGAELYTRTTRYKVPDYVRYLGPLAADSLQTTTRSAAALLIVQVPPRLFAVSFGRGLHLLQEGLVEQDFGLKTALNLVDPSSLRSVDVKKVHEHTITSRLQTSREAGQHEFGIDFSEDFLRAVTGKPLDGRWGKSITGSDGLRLSVDAGAAELHELCGRLLEAYRSNTYKNTFPWVDHLAIVRDKVTIAELSDRVIGDLRRGATGKIHLAPPSVIDWSEVDGFYYPPFEEPEDIHADLVLSEWLARVPDIGSLSVRGLQANRVVAFDTEAAQPIASWSVFECIVSEVSLGEATYVLSGGEFFRIDNRFVAEVHQSAGELAGAPLSMPPALHDETEDAYNTRVGSQAAFVLLHKKLVDIPSPRMRIEACDLLSRTRQLIHVKKRGASATLSHLFAQGVVSGELLHRERRFREGVRRHLDDGARELIALDGFEPRDYEIVFAVMARGAAAVLDTLPFFSKLHFRQQAIRLRDWGFKVRLTRVVEA